MITKEEKSTTTKFLSWWVKYVSKYHWIWILIGANIALMGVLVGYQIKLVALRQSIET